MPYIKKNQREYCDAIVEKMINEGLHYATGSLNYILFKLALAVPPSYYNYKNYLGELHEAECEIRRRILAPYEDQKIKENGDVK